MNQGTAKKSTAKSTNTTKSLTTRDSVRKALESVRKAAIDAATERNEAIQRRLRTGQNAAKKRIQNTTAVYDCHGRFRATKEDICDCFDEKCVGCHFSCEKCSSPKCGPTCRVNRRYIFEEIEYDGKGKVDKNPKIGYV